MDCPGVFEQIQQAVRTLRRLPPAFTRQRMTSWPDFVRKFCDAYGRDDPTPPRIAATPRQLTELDEVIEWLSWLPREYRLVVWAKAEGMSGRKIGKLMDCSEGKVRYMFEHAIVALQVRIAKK